MKKYAISKVNEMLRASRERTEAIEDMKKRIENGNVYVFVSVSNTHPFKKDTGFFIARKNDIPAAIKQAEEHYREKNPSAIFAKYTVGYLVPVPQGSLVHFGRSLMTGVSLFDSEGIEHKALMEGRVGLLPPEVERIEISVFFTLPEEQWAEFAQYH